jgi:glycosyltransferase involved in cell wall biosynthesis
VSELTILSVAYPLAPVGPDAAGGAEQVLTQLDAALVAAGHRSLVVACEGSKVRGQLVATPSVRGALDEDAQRRAVEKHRAVIARILAEEQGIDLVHMHGIDFHRYLPAADIPVLATLHLPPSWYPAEIFMPSRPRTWLNCVSEAQRRACPESRVHVPVIENGVPVDRLAGCRWDGGFALTLGRICPEKAPHLALDAGRLAGVPVLVAGRLFAYPDHERYFRTEIRPRLDRRYRFLGPAGFARKRWLLSAARCLLVPSLAPETSSLVAMEAMACGTPVVAFQAGALADIVEPGRTGFLASDVREMADAIARVANLDPARCREAARRRFDPAAMIRKYLSLYHRLAAGSPP